MLSPGKKVCFLLGKSSKSHEKLSCEKKSSHTKKKTKKKRKSWPGRHKRRLKYYHKCEHGWAFILFECVETSDFLMSCKKYYKVEV